MCLSLIRLLIILSNSRTSSVSFVVWEPCIFQTVAVHAGIMIMSTAVCGPSSVFSKTFAHFIITYSCVSCADFSKEQNALHPGWLARDEFLVILRVCVEPLFDLTTSCHMPTIVCGVTHGSVFWP